MIGILLINLGTPDKPHAADARRYLRKFLSDPRVIDIPKIQRWLLVNLVIAPFRAPRSAAAYRKIWTDSGSPLLIHSAELARQVSDRLGNDYVVELGMRYGKPSIALAMETLIRRGATSIRVLPLYPQYSASATGSAVAEVLHVSHALWDPPKISILPPFYNHAGFIDAFVELGSPIIDDTNPDHILFSFHGLPERQIQKSGPEYCLVKEDCCKHDTIQNHNCYRHQCFVTADAIAKALRLQNDQYSVSFQSRLGRTKWIGPYTDQVLLDLANKGKKKVTVFCPSFVADCLETIEEIGMRGRESFLAAGGERLDLVPCLNAHPTWVKAVCEMVMTGTR
jgi:ferrochelatase